VGYPVFPEGTGAAFFRRRLLRWPAPFVNYASYCCCDLLSACVWEADVQDRFVVVRRHFHSSIYCFQHVRLDEFSLTKYPDAGAIAVEEVAVL
jgi:hypothetical protein